MSGLMLKAVGGLLVVAAGIFFSRLSTERLRLDISLGDGLISGFLSLEEHICGMLVPAEEALMLAAEEAGEAYGVFVSAAGADGDLRDRFSDALKSCGAYKGAVCGFVNGICLSDEKERRTAFSIIRARLSAIRENAVEEYKRLGRLYNTAGILGGVAVVILLL